MNRLLFLALSASALIATTGCGAKAASAAAEEPTATAANDTAVVYFIKDITPENITVKRRLENGVETLRSPLPCVVTVNGSAAECRPRNAMRLQKYKYAASTSEKEKLDDRIKALLETRPYLNIAEWSAAYVDADPEQIGLAGSPTKVKAIENVVFTAKESRCLSDKDNEIEDLIKELIANHTIG